MVKRTTITDVARAAGVSVTTVDRALNGRSIVRDETIRRIADAAHRVGYHGKGILDRRLDQSLHHVKLGFVLLKRSQEFYRNFATQIEDEITGRQSHRISVDIRYSSSQSPDEFADLLTDLGKTCDAIACVAVNDKRLDPVVQNLKDSGVVVISVLNDFAQGIRKGYVGLNNMKVGRLAGWMMTKTVHQGGPLAIFVGGARWHGHDLRETGFRSIVREAGRGFTVLDALVNLETRQVTYEATLDLLYRTPDLKGIYVAGGGMEGAIAAVREVHREPRLALVVNELTVESRSALIDGYVSMVIGTPLKEMCADLVDLMLKPRGEALEAAPSQHFLEPKIILPEML